MNLVDLRNYIKTQKGYAFKSKWFIKAGIPIVKVKDFTDDSISKENVDYINDELACDFDRYLLDTNDVIIQTVGSWASNPNSVVGKAVKVPSALKGALLNQNAVKIIPTEKLDKKFLYYTLRTDDFKGYIVNTAQGSASQASITLESIKNYNFHLPLLHTQKRIADILSACDDLIENNLKRIKLLEQAAQNIYKEWFVNMRFPGYENTPINEETGLPEGWEVKTISDVMEYKVDNRGRNPKYYTKSGIPVIDNHLIKNSPFIDFSKTNRYIDNDLFEVFIRRYLKKDDVLITLVGTVANISLAPEEKSVIVQNTIGIRCNEFCTQEYMYCFLGANKTKIQNKNRGAAQPSVKVGDLTRMKMVIPNNESLNNFSKEIKTMFSLIQILGKQNQKLKAARDILLPRLMNRTIEV